MQKPCRLFFLLPCIVLICACGLGNKPPVFDNDVGWVFENIDASFWTKRGDPDPSVTVFRNFWVHAEDPDGEDDITYVCITDSEDHDTLLENPNTGYSAYDSSGNFWGGWRRYYRVAAPYQVALGTYTTVVRDSAGYEISRTDMLTGPGGASGYSFAYSEEYLGSTVGGTPMLTRATVSFANKLSDRIQIQFTVNDDAVFDGYVWLYDASAVYVGWTNWFRTTTRINGGLGIYNNGSLNTLEVFFTDLDLGTHSPSEIAGFHVVLSDGAQYEPQTPFDTWYDYRSISAYTLFP
jgi:hypothetical protein